MNVYEAILSRRTIREFEEKKVPGELLEKYVNAGRLAPQAANRQPLEFVIVDDDNLAEDFFSIIKLAGYIDWNPSIEGRARAYIVILANTDIQKPHWIGYDTALAAENISLAAWEGGVGSCMIGAFNKQKVRDFLKVPERYDIPLLIALGYPTQKSVAEDMKNDDIEYWRDNDGTFHVPKRPLAKVMHRNKF